MCGGGTIGSRVGMRALLSGWTKSGFGFPGSGFRKGWFCATSTLRAVNISGSWAYDFSETGNRKPETGNRKPETGNRSPTTDLALLARLDPLENHAHDFAIQRALEHVVFDAGVDRRVVVDFYDHDLAVAFLQVDAVQAVSDKAGGLDGGADDRVGGLAYRQRVDVAFVHAGVSVVLDDLPVAARHVVAAYVQRAAVEHAYAPVEGGRQILLSHHQFRGLEQALDRGLEFGGVEHLDHAH